MRNGMRYPVEVREAKSEVVVKRRLVGQAHCSRGIEPTTSSGSFFSLSLSLLVVLVSRSVEESHALGRDVAGQLPGIVLGIEVDRHQNQRPERSRDQGESDKEAGDPPGKFTFANGTATGNGAVRINESNNFEVVF